MHATASCGKGTRHFSQCSRISKGMASLDECRSRLGLHSDAIDHLSSPKHCDGRGPLSARSVPGAIEPSSFLETQDAPYERSVTRPGRIVDPRSLNTRTFAPSAMPRAAVSSRIEPYVLPVSMREDLVFVVDRVRARAELARDHRQGRGSSPHGIAPSPHMLGFTAIPVESTSILPEGVENGCCGGSRTSRATATASSGARSRASPCSRNASKSSISVLAQNSRSHGRAGIRGASWIGWGASGLLTPRPATAGAHGTTSGYHPSSGPADPVQNNPNVVDARPSPGLFSGRRVSS